MSVYNEETYLAESIKSILNQTFNNFEFLIIDDCSTDKTKTILEIYAKKDRRIKLFFNTENMGLTENLNKLILLSKGQYLARMDADDISFSTRFEEQYKLITSNKADLVWTNAYYIDDNCEVICERYQPNIEKTLKFIKKMRNYIAHPTVMYKKDSILSVGLYNTDYITGQDGELWYRMCKNGLIFALLNKPLIKLRVGNNNRITTSRVLKHNKLSFITLAKNNKNYFYANICIGNYKILNSIKYIIKTKNIFLIIVLLIRVIFPEKLFKELIYYNISIKEKYNQIHKN
jgi:glycosyltransferase involved in cell wall biosynthesis